MTKKSHTTSFISLFKEVISIFLEGVALIFFKIPLKILFFFILSSEQLESSNLVTPSSKRNRCSRHKNLLTERNIYIVKILFLDTSVRISEYKCQKCQRRIGSRCKYKDEYEGEDSSSPPIHSRIILWVIHP